MRKNDAWLWDLPVALVLLTRLPLPRLPDHAFARQARAVWAFPLAGALVGLIAGIAGLGALALGLPPTIAAGLLLGAQILLTGAMHEDGLADTADGLWGGWTPDRRLAIMKDSQIGTYGVLALLLSIGLRWAALAGLLTLSPATLGLLVAVGALSRCGMPVLMAALPPARPGGLSASVGRPASRGAAAALVLGAGIAGACLGGAVLLPALFAALCLWGLARLALARIGGQTGDILGAAQQLAETAILLGLAAAM